MAAARENLTAQVAESINKLYGVWVFSFVFFFLRFYSWKETCILLENYCIKAVALQTQTAICDLFGFHRKIRSFKIGRGNIVLFY